MARTDAVALTYFVGISAPGNFRRPWWCLADIGTPAAVARELNRLARQLDGVPAEPLWSPGLCWCHWDVRSAEGRIAEYFVGPVAPDRLPGEMRAMADRIVREPAQEAERAYSAGVRP
ncbi:hypothetical protein [Nocardia mexicana]|uniref:hypothetical protein n=1 Tax=Nocardia mexicana TaxID=279262 RepID=UPI0011C07366|nr:hypothetical protein [Nocardia mexicana]